jgi:hypothetical protein
VKIWTAHEKSHAPPLLLREGFSLGAALFGPFWLAAHRAWVPAGISLLVVVLAPALTNPPASIVLTLGVALLMGLSGRDLVRWSIARTGYLQTGVVTGRSEDRAQAKLLAVRPDLVERIMAAEAAP